MFNPFAMTVERIYDEFKTSNPREKQHALHVALISDIDLIARDLIDKSGGVTRTGGLFDGCAKINNLKLEFDLSINNELGEKYEKLNEQGRSKEIRRILGYYFFNREAYFSTSARLKRVLFY